ncbi:MULTISPECIES: hypothetical protein [Legionella]|uniref:Uncharacterized protein n=1 Tax=Legionella drozanskii LLAP-1 TaxID=1212489 RepID=A0A0W0TC33_9GAMM|nr:MULTISPECIES: hypothetical protein [Legionella]KTC93171.1 hypothetical protein Ldro_0542 [Legionella drozanskii LLAP-1]PJE14179.1 MAG: hypothetical protein CK430_05505 [Legionella sp.]
MNNASIQKALAALITNYNILENYNNYREQIISELNLSQSDANILNDFYESNKHSFTASAKILKKNRWDDIQLSIPISASYIDHQTLSLIWEDYLSAYKITDIVPKNPLVESILFLNFVENSHLLNAVQKELIKYERIRNEVTYKHHENFISPTINQEHNPTEDTMSFYSSYMHECNRIETFEYNISAVIINHPINEEEIVKEICYVLFFKNLNKEGIGTLRISCDGKNIIDNISTNMGSLLEIYEFNKTKLTKKEFLQFIANLKKIGVLSINKKEGL